MNSNLGYLSSVVDKRTNHNNEVNSIEKFISDTLLNANNWQQGNSDMHFPVYILGRVRRQHRSASPGKTVKGVATKFFDFNTAARYCSLRPCRTSQSKTTCCTKTI